MPGPEVGSINISAQTPPPQIGIQERVTQMVDNACNSLFGEIPLWKKVALAVAALGILTTLICLNHLVPQYHNFINKG